jgi:cytochrome P450
MSFGFKTRPAKLGKMESMTTSTSPQCPFHGGQSSGPQHPPGKTPAIHPCGVWPPGPPSGLTGWGLLARMSRGMPEAVRAWRAEYGELVHLRMWPEHQLIVASPALVRELLVQHHDALVRWERGIQVFSQVQGNSVMIAEGPAWSAKRHALQPEFAPRPVKAFVDTIAAAAARALDGWNAGAPGQPRVEAIDSVLNTLTMDVIMRMMFSSEIGADARAAQHAVHEAMVMANREMFWPASWPDWVPWQGRKRAVKATLAQLIARQVEARLAMPREDWPADMLARLLQLHLADREAWPLGAVRDECMTAFLAGHETTAATLGWWAWCMAANPEAQALARREVDAVLGGRAPGEADLPRLGYLAQTLNETMRLYPAAPILMSRRSTREIVLGGWTVPARTMFMIPVFLLHEDAAVFVEPQAFRPERFAPDAPPIPRGAFMPFGAGPRVCLGQHLALAEMTVVAAMVLQRFALSVPQGEKAPEPVLNISLRPKDGLRVGIERRVDGSPAHAVSNDMH